MIIPALSEKRSSKNWLILGSIPLLLFISWYIFSPLVYTGSGFSFEHSRFATITLEAIGENPLNVAGTVICGTSSHEFKVTYVYDVSDADPVLIINEFISLLGTQGNVINEESIDEIVFSDNVFYISCFDFEVDGEIAHVSYAVLYKQYFNDLYYFLCSSTDRSTGQMLEKYLSSFKIIK